MTGTSKIDSIDDTKVTLRNGRVFKIDSFDKFSVEGWSTFDEIEFDTSLIGGGLTQAKTKKFVRAEFE